MSNIPVRPLVVAIGWLLSACAHSLSSPDNSSDEVHHASCGLSRNQAMPMPEGEVRTREQAQRWLNLLEDPGCRARLDLLLRTTHFERSRWIVHRGYYFNLPIPTPAVDGSSYVFPIPAPPCGGQYPSEGLMVLRVPAAATVTYQTRKQECGGPPRP